MTILDRLTGLASPAAALRRAIQLFDRGKPAEAFPLMATAARAGIVDAEYRVARCYLEGSGVPPSRMEGARWLLRAANHGSADAQALLAALYLTGLVAKEADSKGAESKQLFKPDSPGKPDFTAAFDFATKAAEAGSATGQAILGYILTSGPKSMRDTDAAHRWYEKSASAGCAEGCLGFALSLARGGKRENRVRIAEEVRRAADAGLPTATYLLAVLTEHGLGVTRDMAAAVQLYQAAAEKGLPSAQYRLGLALIDGALGDQDVAAGEAWMRRAALAGNIEAAYLLGDRYAKTQPSDFAEAANWYRRAAEAGHQAAARALASLYLTGNGVAQDVEEGARWLRDSANGGNQEAQIDLANLVLAGAAEPGDGASVAGWFEAAASSGDLIAAFNLGLCFANGVGVRQDQGQAAQWLRRAAEGVPEAQYMYARLLQDGRGVAADPSQARVWFARAADAGVLDAQVSLALPASHFGRIKQGGPLTGADTKAMRIDFLGSSGDASFDRGGHRITTVRADSGRVAMGLQPFGCHHRMGPSPNSMGPVCTLGGRHEDGALTCQGFTNRRAKRSVSPLIEGSNTLSALTAVHTAFQENGIKAVPELLTSDVPDRGFRRQRPTIRRILAQQPLAAASSSNRHGIRNNSCR